MLTDRGVDLLRGREVVTERLFQHHARVLVDEIRRRKVVANVREQIG
jgi:hypothetical protein